MEYEVNQTIQEIFIDISIDLILKMDTYNTNKSVHFDLLLPQRGFVKTSGEKIKVVSKTKAEREETKKNVLGWKNDVWNPENALESRLNIDLLGFKTIEEIEKYKYLFMDYGEMRKLLNTKEFLLKSVQSSENKMIKEKEFTFKKLDLDITKITTIKNYFNEMGFTIDLKPKVVPTLTEDRIKEIENHHNKIFRNKTKLTLSTEYGRKQFCVKLLKHIGLGECIKSKKKRFGKTTRIEYDINYSKQIKLIKDIWEKKDEVVSYDF